jgi:hypothetical protein
MFRVSRRELSELPDQRPGTVLVFEVNGGYQEFAERRHLRGSEDALIDAVSVSVIDTRSRSVPVDLAIPSTDLAHDFPVRVTFRCTVTDAVAVVADGLRNVAAVLADHLREDLELQKLGMDFGIEQVHRLRPLVMSRIKAYVEFIPPRINGMRVALSGVDVLLPTDVRDHAMGMKGLRRADEINTVRSAFENKDVARIEEILHRGMAAGLALGVSRNEVPVGEAVVMQRQAEIAEREMEAQRVKYLIDLIHKLPESSLDFLPIDTHVLVQSITRSLLGADAPMPASPPRPAVGDGRPTANGDAPRPLGMEESDD